MNKINQLNKKKKRKTFPFRNNKTKKKKEKKTRFVIIANKPDLKSKKLTDNLNHYIEQIFNLTKIA